LAVTGIGFAAFTSGAFIGASGTAGTVGPLTWGSVVGTGKGGPGASYVSCGYSIGTKVNTSDLLTITAGPLAPGDYCTFAATLYNAGSLPALPSEAIGATSGSAAVCHYLEYSDNIFTPAVILNSGGQTGGPDPSSTIGGHGSYYPWSIALEMIPSAPSVSGTCTFQVTVTGVAT
jgi:hypothetical protein